MDLIDSHCHFYDEVFEENIDEYVAQAAENHVNRIYLPCIDSSVHEPMERLSQKYPQLLHQMMGLHPCYVKENFKDELEKVYLKIKSNSSYAAIGEIGIDKYWDTTFYKEQIFAFEQQMQWAKDFDLPINIHTRNATQETIEMVKPFAQKGVKGIFHCFGGSYETAKQIIDMGFLLGIGGVATYKNAGLSEVLPKIGLTHIVLETDAPYLSPVPYRGKTNQPAYIKIIAEKIAEILNVELYEVAKTTTENCLKVYKSDK